MGKGEIILYQPNESIKLEVRLEEENVWLTQNQIAELLQMPQGNYSRLERGGQDIKFTMIMHICNTLNISADWLLGLDQKGEEYK